MFEQVSNFGLDHLDSYQYFWHLVVVSNNDLWEKVWTLITKFFLVSCTMTFE